MRPRITTAGLAALAEALNGTGIVFSKMKMGNGANPGSYLDRTDLVNTVVTIPITGLDLNPNDAEGYVEITANFSNEDLQSSFDWTEVGIFIEDPEDNTHDILYAYGHVKLESGYESAAAIPAAGTEVYEIELIYRVYVGEAEDISAQIAEYAQYTSRSEFQAHIQDYNNPHRVTATQIGLGNVPNVTTDDQTPTFTEAGTLENIESGETLSTIFGKVKKAISTLISHINNAAKHVGTVERSYWNSKADGRHNHSASDITGGILPVNRGGTGVDNMADLNALFQTPFEIGTFIGDGEIRKDINLGFTPTKVIIWRMYIGAENTSRMWQTNNEMDHVKYNPYDFPKYFEPGKNLYHDACGAEYYSVDADTLFAKKHGGAVVIENGFAVGYPKGQTQGRYDLNVWKVSYMYMAFR